MPLLIIIACLIVLDSRGAVFYKQVRVGKNNKDFKIYKFRTMRTGSDKSGLITLGGTDTRITNVGKFLRAYKLDELPQFINVLNGTMSLVGPRPEVRKYVDLYNDEQRLVLSVTPGITEYASLKFYNEGELLAASTDPETTYVQEVMPEKLRLNLLYVRDHSFFKDLKIILLTVKHIIRH